MSFQITTTAFRAGQMIPEKYTCKGPDVSPPLSWSDVPEGTQAFALIVDDPDAPAGTWVHWVVYNIPASVTDLQEAMAKDPELKDGTRQGMNDFKKLGYNGPCPPPGGPHRYYFRLYALSAKVVLPAAVTRAQLDKAMAKRVLSHTELMGKFKR